MIVPFDDIFNSNKQKINTFATGLTLSSHYVTYIVNKAHVVDQGITNGKCRDKTLNDHMCLNRLLPYLLLFIYLFIA